MGAIEPLLGIVEMKHASGLVLTLGEVPALLLGGTRSPLTMPALSVDMMEHLLADLLSPEDRTALREQGTLECGYRSPTHGTYAIRAHTVDDKLTLMITRGGRIPPAEPRRPAVAPAVPVSVEPRREAPAAAIPLPDTARAHVASGDDAGPFDGVLDQAVVRHASDVLLSTGSTPLLRIDGRLIECPDAAPTSGQAIEAYVLSRLGPERRRVFESTGSVDLAFDHVGSFGGDPVRFRANVFRHGGGVAMALRPILAEIPSLADLHLPATLTEMVDERSGLVVFTGATGSGKSTTLGALLEHVNRTRAAHIVTLEDPIEYAYRARRSIIHQREVGLHVDSFASGLRAALRENPDVLLVGEMRDPETIRMTLTAAQTGHLVLSTLHSAGTVGAIDRMIDGFPESEKSHVRHELAASLRHVVAQQLVPAVGGGRVPALEILTVNHAIASQIRDGRTHLVATHLETGAEDGMVPMARALANLVRSGRVARGVALALCEDREALERLLEDRVGARPRSAG